MRNRTALRRNLFSGSAAYYSRVSGFSEEYKKYLFKLEECNCHNLSLAHNKGIRINIRYYPYNTIYTSLKIET